MSKVMEEVHLTTIKPKNDVLLLAQEISFAKVLACNDKRLRDRGMKRLRKWFVVRSQGSIDLSKEDHMRLWKGLFYCMWMSDKPLVQEDLAEEISSLIHSFASFKASLLFVETFFASLSLEWFGIDQLRLDKFMMLVRRFMRQSFELVARIGWPEEQVQQLANVYLRTLRTAPLGLNMHIIEVFCEELAKVGNGKISSETILQFITMFAQFLATLKDGRLISQITRYVFLHLIRQTEIGVEHQMKFSAWKEYGFPGGDIDAGEKIQVDSESDEELMEGSEDEVVEERQVGPDARAGKVDVLLPPLDFDPTDLLTALRELRNKKETTTRARKTLIQLITKFEQLAEGKYPLGLHKVDLPNKTDKKKEIMKAAKQLYVEEQKLVHNESESEGDGEIEVSLTKKGGKQNKAKKLKKAVWKVSKANVSEEHTESEPNTSWEVSESEPKAGVKLNNSKKRKLNQDDLSDSVSKNETKKSKVSSFSVHDSKENSFSSLVASTPKNVNTKNILKKTSSNQQNISAEVNNVAQKTKNNNKIKHKLVNKNKNQINNKTSTNHNVVSENEELEKKDKLQNNETPLNTTGSPKPIVNDPSSMKEEVKTTDLKLNTSTTENNNGWGGEWDEPLKDGEYEIFIPNKKYVAKRKSLGLSYPVSSFVQKSAEKLTPVNRIKAKMNKTSTPNSQKKVEFNLSANCSQEYKEYTRQVKSSQKQVPFDANKKPVQGLLKNSTPSPINPFYKRKLKCLISPSNT